MTENEDWTTSENRYTGMNAGPAVEKGDGWTTINTTITSTFESYKETTVDPVSDREALLLGAIEAITKQRNNEYGPPTQDFTRTAAFWSFLFAHKLKDGELFESYDIALAQIALKLSRATWSPEKQDHWLDIAGYAGCGWECVVDEEA